jgi:hypothetical protein
VTIFVRALCGRTIGDERRDLQAEERIEEARVVEVAQTPGAAGNSAPGFGYHLLQQASRRFIRDE